MKNEVYGYEPSENRDELEQRVWERLARINPLTRTFFKKCEKGINKNGGHFVLNWISVTFVVTVKF